MLEVIRYLPTRVGELPVGLSDEELGSERTGLFLLYLEKGLLFGGGKGNPISAWMLGTRGRHLGVPRQGFAGCVLGPGENLVPP